MANDKSFKIKNGLLAGRYLQSNGVETAGSVGYNLAGAEYDSVSFSVAAQEDSPRNLAFNNNGTKMYIVGTTSDSVHQYSLSTAFDVSTASYDSVSFSVASQDLNPSSVGFNNDGTKMYVIGFNANSIFQYSLSTAYDISTASYDNKSFSVATQETQPRDHAFNNDGSKMYVIVSNSDTVYQYSLSTAFDVSTASYDNKSFSVATQETTATAVAFNSDGTRMFTIGTVNNTVYQYSLSTAFDVSTASYDNVNFSVVAQQTASFHVEFSADGTKMFTVNTANDTVFQYSTALLTQTLDLSTGTAFSFTPSGATTVSFTNAPASGKAVGFAVEINGDGSAITWPSSVKWDLGTTPTATASKELYTFITVDGGTTYYGKLAGSNIA